MKFKNRYTNNNYFLKLGIVQKIDKSQVIDFCNKSSNGGTKT